MKALIICLLLVSCAQPQPKPQAPKPVKLPVAVKTCKVEGERYHQVFKDLICALRESKQNEGLKSIVLAQWILESGRGNSSLARNHFNFGGLKWRKEMSQMASPIVYNAHDGVTKYVKFPSVDIFIEGYWHFINRYPYKGWEKYKEDGEGFLRHIVKSGYCPDAGYVQKVLSLHKEAKELLSHEQSLPTMQARN